jgi:hypothetical protein
MKLHNRNHTLAAAASLILLFTHGASQAAALAINDKLGIDFGPILTTNWNNITDANGNQTIAAGSVVSISGGILDGVSIVTAGGQFANSDGTNNWVGLQSNPAVIPGLKAPAEFVDSVTTDIAGNFNTGDGNPYTITIRGLNNSFIYSLITAAAASFDSIDTVTVNGGPGQGFSRPLAVSDGLYTSFTGLTTDGSGNLIIRVTDTSTGQNPIINGALLTVIPEPSGALLGAIGFLALLRRRR